MATLRQITPDQLPTLLNDPVDPETISKAEVIVNRVREGGLAALREIAEQFGDVEKGASLVYHRDELKSAYDALPKEDQELLHRVSDRIERFATAQKDALSIMEIDIPGGKAGHDVAPVEIAGCYAPGGGFPLPSSVLMTAVTARAAGVKKVIVASPKPVAITLAAAYVAKADILVAVGGAQVIAALAYGAGKEIPACDVIVGPGNRWVTAAKKIVFGRVGIDMLAGPSELVVLADDNAKPEMIAADLLGQAEHGFDSLPIVVTTSEALIAKVNEELVKQLEVLPTCETAEASVSKGFAVLASSEEEAISVVNKLAPEHLELLCDNATEVAKKVTNYGGLFVGAGTAEVLGDYGAGPNHTLPTGGTARYTGGLSVFDFLRIRTWMRVDDLSAAQPMVKDACDLARHESLEAHARSAEQRIIK
jgi:histidinol dehydrogenase